MMSLQVDPGEEADKMSGHFKRRHFVGEIVLWAVRWYCKYGVSYRDLEERGVDLDHTTLHRWVQSAWLTLEGIETVNSIRKGRVRRASGLKHAS
jgi:transposase-like protein